MPNAPRPPKPAGGNVNYADEVAAGFPDIIDTDVDSDFNTIYRAVNGQLDDDNINFTLAYKKIQYVKLDLTGKIQDSDLVGPIDGAKIGIGTINWDRLKALHSFANGEPPHVTKGAPGTY